MFSAVSFDSCTVGTLHIQRETSRKVVLSTGLVGNDRANLEKLFTVRRISIARDFIQVLLYYLEDFVCHKL